MGVVAVVTMQAPMERRAASGASAPPLGPLLVPFSRAPHCLPGDTEIVAKLTRQQLAERAEQLGHTQLRMYKTKSGKRWVLECACGWGGLRPDGRPSVTRATREEALSTLQWHLWKALDDEYQARVRNGVSLPDVSARS